MHIAKWEESIWKGFYCIITTVMHSDKGKILELVKKKKISGCQGYKGKGGMDE